MVFLKKKQTLFSEGFNEDYIYIVLFGRLRLYDTQTGNKVGQSLNIGWTAGEDILFRNGEGKSSLRANQICKASSEACVLGLQKRSLAAIKTAL